MKVHSGLGVISLMVSVDVKHHVYSGLGAKTEIYFRYSWQNQYILNLRPVHSSVHHKNGCM